MVELAGDLLISFELPTSGFQNVLKISVCPSFVDTVLDTVAASVGDLMEELPESTAEHLQNTFDDLMEGLRSQAKAHLEEWEGKLATAQELKVKGEKAVQKLRQMREAYYKELSSYRQQLYLKSKAEASGEKFNPESVIHFDPAEYLDDELAQVLYQKVEIMEHKHAAETKRLRAQIDTLTEQVKTKAFFLNAKDELVIRYKEDIQKRDSVNSEELRSQIQELNLSQGGSQSEDTTDPSDDVDPIIPQGRPQQSQKGQQKFVARSRPAMAEANVGTDPRPILVDSFTQSDIDSSIMNKAARLCAEDAESACKRLLNCQEDSDSDDASLCDKMNKIDTNKTTEVPTLANDILTLLREGGLGEDGKTALTKEVLDCLPGLQATLDTAYGDCDLDSMSEMQASFGHQSISHQHMAPMLLNNSIGTSPKSPNDSAGESDAGGQASFHVDNNCKPEQRTVGVQVESDLLFQNVARSLEHVLMDPSKMTVAQLLHRHSVKPSSPGLQAKRRPRALQAMVRKSTSNTNDSDLDDDLPPAPSFNRQSSDPVKGASSGRPSAATNQSKSRGTMEVRSLDVLPDAPTQIHSSVSVVSSARTTTTSMPVCPINSGLSLNSHGSNVHGNNVANGNSNSHGHSGYGGVSLETAAAPSASPKRRSLSTVSIGSSTWIDEVGDPSRPGSVANSVRVESRTGPGTDIRSRQASREPCYIPENSKQLGSRQASREPSAQQPSLPETPKHLGRRRRTIMLLPETPLTARAATSPLEDPPLRRSSAPSVGSVESMFSLGDTSPNGTMIKLPAERPTNWKRRPSMEGSEVLTMPMSPNRRNTVRRVQSDISGNQSPRPVVEKGKHHHRQPMNTLGTNSELLPSVCPPHKP